MSENSESWTQNSFHSSWLFHVSCYRYITFLQTAFHIYQSFLISHFQAYNNKRVKCHPFIIMNVHVYTMYNKNKVRMLILTPVAVDIICVTKQSCILIHYCLVKKLKIKMFNNVKWETVYQIFDFTRGFLNCFMKYICECTNSWLFLL